MNRLFVAHGLVFIYLLMSVQVSGQNKKTVPPASKVNTIIKSTKGTTKDSAAIRIAVTKDSIKSKVKDSSALIHASAWNAIPVVSTYFSIQSKFVKKFTADSFSVFVKPAENNFVSLCMILPGGCQGLPAGKDGLNNMSLQWALLGGSRSMSYNDAMNAFGNQEAQFTMQQTYDANILQFTCLQSHFSACWKIFSEMIFHPLLDKNAYFNIRDSLLNANTQNSSSIASLLLARALLFPYQSTSYENGINGNSKRIQLSLPDDVRKYYFPQISPGRAYFSVSGNIPNDQLQKIMDSTIIPFRMPPPMLFNLVDKIIPSSTLQYFSSDTGINYITGVCDAPSPYSMDDFAFQLAISILQNRLQASDDIQKFTSGNIQFNETGRFYNHLVFSFSATDPDRTIQAVYNILKDIKTKGFTKDELQSAKDNFTTQYYLSNQDDSSQSVQMGLGLLYSGTDVTENITKIITAIQLRDINAVIKTYIKAFRFVFTGDQSSANELIFTQPF
jgi:zinc protease